MIHIIDDWYLDSEVYGYVLKHDTGKLDKTGSKKFDKQKYPKDIVDAIEILIEIYKLDLAKNKEEELYAYLKDCRKVCTRFNRILKKIEKEVNLNGK